MRQVTGQLIVVRLLHARETARLLFSAGVAVLNVGRKWAKVFIADQNGNTKWCETMQFGREDWSIFIEKLLKRLHLPAILDYLAKSRVTVARSEEKEKKNNDDKIARRIAHNFENWA
eukprot:4722742-Pyramimonas_sp.AAC.1